MRSLYAVEYPGCWAPLTLTGALIVIVSTPPRQVLPPQSTMPSSLLPCSPVACQSPASRSPVVRQSIACSASRQPHTSHSPATRLLLACCSADPDQLSFAPPPRHADVCSAPSSTHQASSRYACRLLSRTPAARLPLARQPLACHSPVARQCCMSGAPPAARQPSASCSLAPCQLRSCRSPVARQSLASRSPVALVRPRRRSRPDAADQQGWPRPRYQRLL